MSSYNNQVPTPNKLIKKRTEQKKKIVVSNRKKKLKMGLSKVNGGCQIEKRKKSCRQQKGVSSSKNKKKSFGPPTSISHGRGSGWVVFSVRVAVVHAVLVTAVRVALGGRCRARRHWLQVWVVPRSWLVAGVVGRRAVLELRGRGLQLHPPFSASPPWRRHL